MTKPSLHIVADPEPPASPQAIAQRIRDLQAQARALVKDHVRQLSAQLLDAQTTAAEIANGGDAYPPGIRDLASRLIEDAEARVQTLEAIASRTL